MGIHSPTRSRRSVLRALGIGGATALSGCASVLGNGTRAVRVLCAGSLQRTLLALSDAVDPQVEIEAHGSAAAARLVAEGSRDPDVVALADPALFESVLESWYATIATSELVVAYDPETAAGRRLDRAKRWIDPVLDGRISLGRTDPDLDPLGYRTLFAFDLAAEHYDRPKLATDLRERSRIYPETSLLARLDTGAVDAAVVYRPMARDRGFATLDLPPAIDLSDPDHAARYREQTYQLPDGTQVRGSPIEYAATARRRDDATLTVFDAIASGDLLADHGFHTPSRYPAFEGDVPDAVA